MIVLGEIQSYGKRRMKIITHKGSVEVMFREEELVPIPFSLGDRILLHAPHVEGNKIEYTKSIKISGTPLKTISEIRKEKYCDVIALCNEYRTLVKTKGTDFLFSLVLNDHTGTVELKVFTDQAHYNSVIESNKGEPFKRGDVLLIRNIKTGGSSTTAVTTKPFSITKLTSCDAVPAKSKDLGFVEWATAQFIIENCTKSSTLPILTKKTHPSFGSGKIKKISEITDRSFFNIIGKVIHCDSSQGPTISITDFTESELIEPGLGPFPCNMALIIRLFGQHLTHLKKVKVGGYYMFENIRIHTFSNVLEAYMHDNLAGDVIPITDEALISDIKSREAIFHRPLRENSEVVENNPIIDWQPPCNVVGSDRKCNDTTENELTVCRSHSKDAGFTIPITPIHLINTSGLFLSICLLKKIEYQPDAHSGQSFVTLINCEREYRLETKTMLHQKLIAKKMNLGKEYRCLVMMSEGTFYLAEIFAKNSEYSMFLEFCKTGVNKAMC